MPSWKFTDQFATKYPALRASVLNMLVFSDHTITGSAFTGTIDVAASGVVLATLQPILNVSSIPVTGSVTDSGTTLTVTFDCTDKTMFVRGITARLDFLAKVLTAADISERTICLTTDDPDVGPKTDELLFSITLAINASSSVTLTCGVPMYGGLFTLDGTFDNVGIQLSDIQFLMGSASSTDWFPGKQLGPYYQGGPALSLLGISITLYVNVSPFSIVVSSISAGIGITGIDLYERKLYLSPIGVWVLVDLQDGEFEWAIEGALALCNYGRPGDYRHPDVLFDFSMDLTNLSISGELENPEKVTVATMVQDLAGAGTSIGLSDRLTIDSFSISAAADKSTGKLTEFSTSLAMSGGFGILENFDIEQISLSLDYSA
jgi:hypothetical protein